MAELFLCGDVMLGRGIDQVLPASVDPTLHEPYVRDARDYVALAERAHGPIAAPVTCEYVWGDALRELRRHRPHARIVNLETSITTSDEFWPGKGIHYRMHPANVAAIEAAGIDCCVLANNHVLDWGRSGLIETLRVLRERGIAATGAGRDDQEAAAPAALDTPAGRVLVFAYGSPSSGVPRAWVADAGVPGVNVLHTMSDWMVGSIADAVRQHRRRGDVVVFSVHWGPNWGYEVPGDHRRFAHRLIDVAGVDVVHGHSSHHPMGIEVYRERPVFYGCGDFLNDYEGIGGHEEYRSDLSLMYFPTLDAGTGRLLSLRLVPMQVRRMRLGRASADDARWLRDTLNRESERFGLRFAIDERGDLLAEVAQR